MNLARKHVFLGAAVAIACLLAHTTPAAAGWRQLEGKRARNFSAASWLHVTGDKPTRKGLKGKVWLLAFMGGY